MTTEHQEELLTLVKDWDRLQTVYPEWKSSRENTVNELEQMAEYLHNLEKRVCISNITTSAVGIPLGVTSMLSLALFLTAPATGGISAVAGVIAAISGISGAVVGTGGIMANLAQFGIKKTQANKLVTILESDKEMTQRLTELLVEMDHICKEVDISMISMDTWDVLTAGKDAATGAWRLGEVGKNAYDSVQVGTKLISFVRSGEAVFDTTVDGVSTLSKLSRFSRLLTVVGVIGSGLGLTLDVFTLVWTSIKVHKGSKCALGDKMAKIASELQNELKNFICAIEPLLL